MSPKKIVILFGTRPEAIKMAPVIRALEKSTDFKAVTVSTGQHREMLQQVIDLFGIHVNFELDVMTRNQTLAKLSSRLLQKIDSFLEVECPDFVLVEGDTTSVLMAALACFYRHIPIGHVEAGLRTGNIWSPFPEEVNRKLVTPLAALHFAPTDISKANLLAEGISQDIIVVTGNTVIDALRMEVGHQMHPEISTEIESIISQLLGCEWHDRRIVLITGHRRENFGGGFEAICHAVAELSRKFPDVLFVYPVHLNPNVMGPVYERLSGLINVKLIPPQSYRPFVALLRCCILVLTDSGGVQEEAPSLGKPVLVMRDTTERPEGVMAGTARLVGVDTKNIVSGVTELLNSAEIYRKMSTAQNPYGDGYSSGRIVAAIRRYFQR